VVLGFELWTLHVSGIEDCVAFLSLHTIFSRFIYV
jgi:hypothetical protein